MNLVGALHEALAQMIQLVHSLCQKMREAQNKAQLALAAIVDASKQQILKARQEVEALLSSAYKELVTEACREMAKLIVAMDGIVTRVKEAAVTTSEALHRAAEEAHREIKELLPRMNKLHLDMDVGFDTKIGDAIKAISDFVLKAQKEIEKAVVVPGCCQVSVQDFLPFAGMAKVLFSFCQIVSTFSTSFPSVPWPESFVTAWNSLSVVVNLDLFGGFSPECATPGSFTFYDQLLVTVIGFAACLLVITGVSWIRYTSAEDDLAQRQANIQGWRVTFLFLFAVFPSVNATILQAPRQAIMLLCLAAALALCLFRELEF